MTTWETTTIIEQQEIQHLGEEFYSAHKAHVTEISKDKEYVVAPSGSDLFKPELWKGIHWNWFFETFGTPMPPVKKKPTLWDEVQSAAASINKRYEKMMKKLAK